THLDLVRTGIAMYGVEPAPGVSPQAGLRPSMAWRTRVTLVKRLAAGERVSYGLRYRLDRDSTIATVPVGYADGYPRALSSRADARGGRCFIGVAIAKTTPPSPSFRPTIWGRSRRSTAPSWRFARRGIRATPSSSSSMGSPST